MVKELHQDNAKTIFNQVWSNSRELIILNLTINISMNQ